MAAPDRFTVVSWARLALLALLGSVLVLLVSAGLRSLLWMLVAMAAVAVAAVGTWWALAHSGWLRVTGALLAPAALVAVLALFVTHGVLAPALLSLALWLLALAAARISTTPARRTAGQGNEPVPVPAAQRPWVVMNPRSGGGKVERFRLAEKARAAGVRVVVLDPDHRQDVAELARRALADGADLLAVAGGDGTQALVAEVAAAHDVPFVVIPAGTRNHFALDLGLDRDDPAAGLEAFTDAVEFRVDLGFAAGRVFVNNASFGTYAAVVGDPAYRDAKPRTTLQALPGLLTGPNAPRLRMRAGRRHAEGLQAVLVSNNPYRPVIDPAAPGLRESLDSGRLGVLGLRVENSAQAALALTRDRRSTAVTRLTAHEVVVDADPGADADPPADLSTGTGTGTGTGTETGSGGGKDVPAVPSVSTVPAGIDGESVLLPAPVVCRVVPGALRVRVPRHRPGTPPNRPRADWRRVTRLALTPLWRRTGRTPADR
ncbi:diacylglycerol/lipid kinase family protein [Streptomyces sp. NPDC091217]|uniref:diacylglycerol/lipid kinase family protein n=1 Tax=Streptomyces sp. NPDC091217 TaxID=3365975 RepID=UPI00382B5B62